MTRRDKGLIVALLMALFAAYAVIALTLAMQVRRVNQQLAADHRQAATARETLYDHLSAQDCEIIMILTTRLPAADATKYKAQAGCRG